MLRPAARGAGAISGNGRQQCLDFWVDRMLRFRTRQGRLLRRKRPTFVTHFNREDGRPLVIQSGRYPSGDSRRHQKILQFGMAGSLAGVPPYGICWCGPFAMHLSVTSNGSRSSHQRFRCVALIAGLLCRAVARSLTSWKNPCWNSAHKPVPRPSWLNSLFSTSTLPPSALRVRVRLTTRSRPNGDRA
jgi:hypothetical protein